MRSTPQRIVFNVNPEDIQVLIKVIVLVMYAAAAHMVLSVRLDVKSVAPAITQRWQNSNVKSASQGDIIHPQSNQRVWAKCVPRENSVSPLKQMTRMSAFATHARRVNGQVKAPRFVPPAPKENGLPKMPITVKTTKNATAERILVHPKPSLLEMLNANAVFILSLIHI